MVLVVLVAVVALVLSGCTSAPRGESNGPATTPVPTTAAATTVPTTAPATTVAPPVCPSSPTTWPLTDRLEQLLMVSGRFSDLGASAPEAAAGVGGFVFFGQPAAGAGPAIGSGLGQLAADAAGAGHVVPWMSTDEEGGSVARLSNVIGALPSPRQMAVQWSPSQVTAAMQQHGSAMRGLGITMDLAPVVDTASPSDTVADESERSFSDDPQTVAAYGNAYGRGLRAAGVVPVVKHFPGLGHASANTDTSPSETPPLSQLQSDDLVPFASAISAGMPVVMVGHMTVPGLTGGLPASLVPATYRLLRDTYHFSGVALTDDLNAVAVSAAGYSQAQAAVAAIEAGADMAMIDAAQWPAAVSALTSAVAGGRLPVGQVDASVSRIEAAKGIPPCPAAASGTANG